MVPCRPAADVPILLSRSNGLVRRVGEIGRVQRPHTRSRQLDGQRQPVEPGAHIHDADQIRAGGVKIGSDSAGTVRTADAAGESRRRTVRRRRQRQRQRCDRSDTLAGNT